MSPLNRTQPPDAEPLRVLILSTPKTGNLWLRWLFHYLYDLPIVDLPLEWPAVRTDDLPLRFVSHQHFVPTASLVDWLIRENVTVLTTVRHPGDAFVSLFHYVKWRYEPGDPFVDRLRNDGETPGRFALDYLHRPFPQALTISEAWDTLGAHVVRYEDMLHDPVGVANGLVQRIRPLPIEAVRSAVLLCNPVLMRQAGDVETRHLRAARAGSWVEQLSDAHKEALSSLPGYCAYARRYGYSLEADEPRRPFDYGSIDPFGGQYVFDNGERMSPGVVRLYLRHAPDARQRWPQPQRTDGDSFWNWLCEPCPEAAAASFWPPETLPNALWHLHGIRSDLQAAYPDPVHEDRHAFVEWSLGQAHREFGLPWGVLRPVQLAHAAALGRSGH